MMKRISLRVFERRGNIRSSNARARGRTDGYGRHKKAANGKMSEAKKKYNSPKMIEHGYLGMGPLPKGVTLAAAAAA